MKLSAPAFLTDSLGAASLALKGRKRKTSDGRLLPAQDRPVTSRGST